MMECLAQLEQLVQLAQLGLPENLGPAFLVPQVKSHITTAVVMSPLMDSSQGTLIRLLSDM